MKIDDFVCFLNLRFWGLLSFVLDSRILSSFELLNFDQS